MDRYKLTRYKNGMIGPKRFAARIMRRRTIFTLKHLGSGVTFPFFTEDHAEGFVKDTGGEITERVNDLESTFTL